VIGLSAGSTMNEHPTIEHDDQGGEVACYAHLLCPECGAVVDESHDANCDSTDQRPLTIRAD
jgi:hypothetical protein